MAEDLNRVTLVGRPTRDPEVRGNGVVMSIRLASTRRDKDPDDGEWKDMPNYFDVVFFGEKRIAGIEPYVKKGTRIGIDGTLAWREWQDKDGNNRQSVEIRADNLFLLDSRESSGRSDLPVADEPKLADDGDAPF
jgi:single-strand DNA-binding protein